MNLQQCSILMNEAKMMKLNQEINSSNKSLSVLISHRHECVTFLVSPFSRAVVKWLKAALTKYKSTIPA